MSTPAPSSRSQAPGTRPWTASTVTVLVALEALGLLVLAAGFLVSLFSGHVLPLAGVLFAAVVLAGGSVWLAAASRGAWRGQRWPRAAILVSQAFLLIVGLSLLRAAFAAWGAALAVLAVTTILCLFAPPTVAWMHRTRAAATA
ncbi:hypothetical protein [Kocuria sp.]|uniref:hypothetical protein n=1 Tax=Kocuria sp. TaxID=1871328 RepID=UPI0026DD5C48|nr:hypothetical protein [Kocuria sp.]MDO4918639.1 hypothetical protein [Kocuria sp.]